MGAVIICLAPPLLTESSDLTRPDTDNPGRSEPLLNRYLFGLAPRRDCPFHLLFPPSAETETRLCCSPAKKISAGPPKSCGGNPLLTEGGYYPLRCSLEPGLSSLPPQCKHQEERAITRSACLNPKGLLLYWQACQPLYYLTYLFF